MPARTQRRADVIADPWFYAAAVPAVLLFGIAKGGFGGAIGLLAVPLMALVVPPLTAAAILLPILCVMDLVTLWAYRGRWVWPELYLLLPASLVGIAAGALLFGLLDTALVRLLLGALAIAFAVQHWLLEWRGRQDRRYPKYAGIPAAAAAGFTSFIAHAGGPPITVYLLRRGLDRTAFVATCAVFFTVVNYVKLLPYTWLGQFDAQNLATSLVLAPLAPLGIGLGVWMHRRLSERRFFQIAWVLLLLVGLRLVATGLSGDG